MTAPKGSGSLQGATSGPFPVSMKHVAPVAPVPLLRDLVTDLAEHTAQLRAWRLSVDTRQVTDTADLAFRRSRALAKSGSNNVRTIPQHNEKARIR